MPRKMSVTDSVFERAKPQAGQLGTVASPAAAFQEARLASLLHQQLESRAPWTSVSLQQKKNTTWHS